jgi:Family of unknown function (DUF6314)
MLQLFKQLRGVWKIERRLGTQGHMKGIAYFQPWGKGVLHYQEQGSTTLGNGKALASYRAYAYVYDQGNIAVHFWDQQQRQPAGLLHTLQFHSTETTGQTLVATGTHRCTDDVYQACYTFVHHQHFRLTYQVQGPRKDYTIQTHFSRVGDMTRSLQTAPAIQEAMLTLGLCP